MLVGHTQGTSLSRRGGSFAEATLLPLCVCVCVLGDKCQYHRLQRVVASVDESIRKHFRIQYDMDSTLGTVGGVPPRTPESPLLCGYALSQSLVKLLRARKRAEVLPSAPTLQQLREAVKRRHAGMPH